MIINIHKFYITVKNKVYIKVYNLFLLINNINKKHISKTFMNFSLFIFSFMKKIFRKIHLYKALFTIPVGIMIALTGALYVLGADQDTGAVKKTYTVNQIIPAGEEFAFLEKWTAENNVKMPKKNLSKDKSGLNRQIGSASYTMVLKEKDGITEISTTKRSILGNMIMLHKAKGGILFKIMLVLYGIVLLGFYISGLIITVYKKNVNGKLIPKTENYFVIAAGFIVTIIFAVLSL